LRTQRREGNDDESDKRKYGKAEEAHPILDV